MGVFMTRVAPKARKHLSADALFGLVRNGFAPILDARRSETDIACADALMAAFAMFSLKAPSLLAFDKERVEGNLHTIFGIEHVPCDTRRREMLDPVSPKVLRPVFKRIFRQLQRGKALEPMAFLDVYRGSTALGPSPMRINCWAPPSSIRTSEPACRQTVCE
jgi:hypothetical protein